MQDRAENYSCFNILLIISRQGGRGANPLMRDEVLKDAIPLETL